MRSRLLRNRLRRWQVGLTVAPFLLVAPLPAQQPEATLHQARISVVRLVATSAEGRQFFGSAVVLRSDTVATNCHVTRLAQKVQVLFGNAVLIARSQRADPVHDLCVLDVPGLDAPGVQIADPDALKVGDRVHAMGYSAFQGFTHQAGTVSGLFQFDAARVIESDAAFPHGASGGGLFDVEGRLVGLLTFYRTADEAQADYFSIPIGWLKHLDNVAATSIAPTSTTPFWADPLERQPLFLQAGALEVAGLWNQLLPVAERWTRMHPEDPHAWLTLGKAALRTGNTNVVDRALLHLTRLALFTPHDIDSGSVDVPAGSQVGGEDRFSN